MRREFGDSEFEIRELPSGERITCERFMEFERSYNFYRKTATYEKTISDEIKAARKPLVFTEGETDVEYIQTSLKVFGREDLIELLEIKCVGTSSSGGSRNCGTRGLDNARRIIELHPELIQRSVLLLYDSDASKPCTKEGHLILKSIPKNKENTRVKRGIENLFNSDLFTEQFYNEKIEESEYGEQKKIQSFKKTEFCKWICNNKKDRETFSKFSDIIDFLDEFSETNRSAGSEKLESHG